MALSNRLPPPTRPPQGEHRLHLVVAEGLRHNVEAPLVATAAAAAAERVVVCGMGDGYPLGRGGRGGGGRSRVVEQGSPPRERRCLVPPHVKPLAATSGARLHGTHELCQRQMRSTTVAGARRAAAAGHAPEAEHVGQVPPALRRAIWSADVQQSTAAVSAAFWDKMVPAHDASLMQVAHSSLLLRQHATLGLLGLRASFPQVFATAREGKKPAWERLHFTEVATSSEERPTAKKKIERAKRTCSIRDIHIVLLFSTLYFRKGYKKELYYFNLAKLRGSLIL